MGLAGDYAVNIAYARKAFTDWWATDVIRNERARTYMLYTDIVLSVKQSSALQVAVQTNIAFYLHINVAFICTESDTLKISFYKGVSWQVLTFHTHKYHLENRTWKSNSTLTRKVTQINTIQLVTGHINKLWPACKNFHYFSNFCWFNNGNTWICGRK